MKRSFGHEDAALATPESLSSIVANHNIRLFLDGNEKRYVVGPKGSGKSLLLLRKAIDQRAKGDSLCIPSDTSNPVDRLVAAQHVGQRFNYMIGDPAKAHLAWATVWKHSIYRSIVDHLRDLLVEELSGRQSLLSGSHAMTQAEMNRLTATQAVIEKYANRLGHAPRGPYYYYTELGNRLDSGGHKTVQEVGQENMELEGILQLIPVSVYVFLDNLDDYYEREPELWYNSMYGQFRAVREIGFAYRHIHVFTSIRQDVYNQFADELSLQYFDYITKLSYTRDELARIFQSHLEQLDDSLLVQPGKRSSDPWAAFFGPLVKLPHERAGVEEDISDYIVRHTLGRPRDMIHMGTVMLENRPEQGFDRESLRAAVHHASVDIARQYIAEVTPLLDPRFNIREFVSGYLPGSLFKKEDMDAITDRYLSENFEPAEIAPDSDFAQPFETLFGLGLLGMVRQKIDGVAYEQHFLPPSQGLEYPEKYKIRNGHVFVLHPILSGWLSNRVQSHNFIIGPELPVAV